MISEFKNTFVQVFNSFLLTFFRLPSKFAFYKNWECGYGNNLPFFLYMRYLNYSNFKDKFVFTFLRTFKYMVYPNNDMSRVLYITGTYEPNTLFVLSKILNSGDVFVDIGANTGIYSIVASHLVGSEGKVFSFEPSSREFSLLNENLFLNSLKNVYPNKLALSNESCFKSLKLAVSHHNGQNTLCSEFIYNNVDSYEIELVKSVTFDQYIAENQIKKVNVIKIDVEGSEFHVLIGASKCIESQKPILIFEFLQQSYKKNNLSESNLDLFFRSVNYSVFSIDYEKISKVYSFVNLTLEGNFIAIHNSQIDKFQNLFICT